MINQLSLWQLAVDLGLITAVFTIAFRSIKASRAQALLPQTLELEAALKSLMADAEIAGKHLNDQLLRRESAIQKYLTELEESERRVSRSVLEGEEVGKRIESIAATAQARLNELLAARGTQAQRPRQQAASEASADDIFVSEGQPATAPQRPMQAQKAPARPTPERPSQQDPRRPQAPQRSASEAASAREPSRASASAPTARSASAYAKAASTEGSEVQKVYAAAEKMLREGVELERVAARTKLPVEGVKMLSQMIEVDRGNDESKGSETSSVMLGDPRLGALGTTRRQPNA